MSTSRREQLIVHALPGTHGTTVTARRHELTIDETQQYGGHDSGANPVEHMLAGIASVSLVVLRLLGEVAIAESAALPYLAARRPGQALIDAAASVAEEVSVRASATAGV
ncbi:OsmC family protein [Rhodococcus sp. NPDC057529]|uniref:OsmC family protein n=1 Tax=Rhodococcus sp. NPDC057529 TaxID=3346158 RepID=UPI00366FEE4F